MAVFPFSAKLSSKLVDPESNDPVESAPCLVSICIRVQVWGMFKKINKDVFENIRRPVIVDL